MMKLWGKKYLQETDCLDFADRPGYFLLLSTADQAVDYSDKYLPRSNYIGVSRDERIHFFHPIDDKANPFKKIMLRYWHHPHWLNEQYAEACRSVVDLEKTIKKWQGDNSSLTLRRLYKLHLRARFLAIRGINILRKTDAALQKFISEQCPYLKPEVLQTLSYPDQSSIVMQETQAILHAAAKWRKRRDKELLLKLAKRIYHNFAASTMGWNGEAPRPFSYYTRQIKYWSTRRPHQILAEIRHEQQQHLRLRQKARRVVNQAHRPLIKIMPAMPYLKDAVKLQVNLANFYFIPVFAAMSKKYHVRVQDIWRMSVEEVFTMMATGRIPPKDILVKRKNLYVYYSYQGHLEIFYGQKARYFLKHFYQRTNSLKPGRVASPGHACGQVCIVRSQKDFPKFKKGNILVVNNTTPDFVPIMKKAAAIVAEEGGITAHVSIVSRELKIPSVIGVYKATSLLKDGDRVEVDAIKGIVKKL